MTTTTVVYRGLPQAISLTFGNISLLIFTHGCIHVTILQTLTKPVCVSLNNSTFLKKRNFNILDFSIHVVIRTYILNVTRLSKGELSVDYDKFGISHPYILYFRRDENDSLKIENATKYFPKRDRWASRNRNICSWVLFSYK